MNYTEEQYKKNTRDSFQAGREVGADEEMTRITKLLTEFDNAKYFEWLRKDDVSWPEYWEVAQGIRLAIELIKEKKK